jgi:hypothetical protein
MLHARSPSHYHICLQNNLQDLTIVPQTFEKDKGVLVAWSQGSKNLPTKATNALHNRITLSKPPTHYSNKYNDIR